MWLHGFGHWKWLEEDGYEMTDVLMGAVYERNVSHCKSSPYVREVTLATVKHANNSDNLDCVTFEEFGWNAIVGRDTYKPGDKVTFIPPESVLPAKLAVELGIANYLSKGRVRIVRLRGNRSEGIVLDAGKLSGREHLVLKWEDLPTGDEQKFALPREEVSPHFEKFYHMPQLLNEPYTFTEGEVVVYSEKIHGRNFRFGVCAHPADGERAFYCGSHRVTYDWKTAGDANMFTEMANKIYDSDIVHHMETDVVFFAEIYGCGVQHLNYGLADKQYRVYAIMEKGEYLSYGEVEDMCENLGLPYVQFYETLFESIEQFRELADLPCEYAQQLREGVVIVSKDNPRKMAKVIGFKYLTKKRKSRTERH
jgi:RNA ligase (TIGR02306 family)